MNRRSSLLVLLVVLVAVAIGVGSYFITHALSPAAAPAATPTPPQASATPALQASATPTQSSSPPSPPSPEPENALVWVAEATTPPGRPTPTVPPGVFLFHTAAGTLVANPTPAGTQEPMHAETHTDSAHGYAIHYPAHWTRRPSTVRGQQVLTVYPPGASPGADVPGGADGISFGWTTTAPSFDAHDSAYTDRGAVTTGGVRGKLFTIGGPMGYVVTAFFPHRGGFVVLSADAGSGALLATFQQMLVSLTFS